MEMIRDSCRLAGSITRILALIAGIILLSPSPSLYGKLIWNKDTGWVDPITLNPRIPDQHFKLAMSMMVDQQYESAVKEFKAVMKADKDGTLLEHCLSSIAQAYLLAGKYMRAFDAYEDFLERLPGTRLSGVILEKEYQAGVALMESKPTSAVEIFEKVIEHNPKGPLAPESQVKLADAYFMAMEYESAEEAYRKLLENYPKSEWGPYAMFRIPLSKLTLETLRERDLGRPWKAREGFKEYLANYPAGNIAEEDKKKIHETEESIARRQYDIAELYLRKKHPQAAMVHFEGVVNHFPNTSWAEKSREQIEFLKKINATRK
ncbi:MAG TPA: outer membrane protein assembly factor BamD [Candidatus Tripitaka californicus]|uniref:outer membrane protein assembly factor BamD n=1 Tax=Candidatus Tripitaka californicus TaxID=3367616 RepID=UPI0040299F2A